MKELNIGFLQQHNTADKHDNMRRLHEGVADLASRGAQLIVLQELHNTQYFCQTEDVSHFDLAEPIPLLRMVSMARSVASKEPGLRNLSCVSRSPSRES